MLARRLFTACGALALATAAPVFAQQSGAQQPGAATDREFVINAALSGMAEVQFAQAAQEKATAGPVKEFAAHMLDDHRKINDRLRQLAQSEGVRLPDSMNAADAARLKSLKQLDGVAFDYRYMGGQEEAHENAVRLFEEELANGKDPEVQKLARETLPTLLNHLMSAKVISYDLARGNPRLSQGGPMETTGSAGSTIVTPQAPSGTPK
ncbi:MAG TPA: DUF4142 domain-containing protein [Azospirillum sp.]|nr:DUF4142 domain-containing protein [Azospirillum sp.]